MMSHLVGQRVIICRLSSSFVGEPVVARRRGGWRRTNSGEEMAAAGAAVKQISRLSERGAVFGKAGGTCPLMPPPIATAASQPRDDDGRRFPMVFARRLKPTKQTRKRSDSVVLLDRHAALRLAMTSSFCSSWRGAARRSHPRRPAAHAVAGSPRPLSRPRDDDGGEP